MQRGQQGAVASGVAPRIRVARVERATISEAGTPRAVRRVPASGRVCRFRAGLGFVALGRGA